MSLNHEFVLLKEKVKTDRLYFDFNEYYENNTYEVLKKVELHDDMIAYLMDSFAWVDTIIPDDGYSKRDIKGLARFGITEFQNINLFQQIIEAWIQLFLLAPDKFTLTGEYECVEGENSPGRYAEIPVNKNEFINNLTNLSDMCTQYKNNPENKHFVHLGI